MNMDLCIRLGKGFPSQIVTINPSTECSHFAFPFAFHRSDVNPISGIEVVASSEENLNFRLCQWFIDTRYRVGSRLFFFCTLGDNIEVDKG